METTASGDNSHAEGNHTIAAGDNQHVSGKYNIEDSNDTYAEIVGNGTSYIRSNARTLDWSGNESLAGNIDAAGFGSRLAALVPNSYIELTQAEYDALTPAEKMSDTPYLITDANGDGSQFQPVIYSTTEREIGVWIDGSPVYEKTISIDNISGTSYETSALGLNISKLVSFFAYIHLGSDGGYSWMTTPHTEYAQRTYKLDCCYQSGDDKIHIQSDWGLSGGIFVMRYTKSTDTPGSGIWTPQGVPAVHYSTDEQVVGTWIDGSTLYEKTFEYNGSYEGDVELANQFSGIGECFISEAFCINQSDAVLPLPYCHRVTGNTITLFINGTKTGFYIRIGEYQTLSHIVIVMRYTKSST